MVCFLHLANYSHLNLKDKSEVYQDDTSEVFQGGLCEVKMKYLPWESGRELPFIFSLSHLSYSRNVNLPPNTEIAKSPRNPEIQWIFWYLPDTFVLLAKNSDQINWL